MPDVIINAAVITIIYSSTEYLSISDCDSWCLTADISIRKGSLFGIKQILNFKRWMWDSSEERISFSLGVENTAWKKAERIKKQWLGVSDQHTGE